MKSIVSFILGFIAGVVSLFLLALIIKSSGGQDKTMFETPGECISTSKMQVIQVIDENSAIAYEVEYNDV